MMIFSVLARQSVSFRAATCRIVRSRPPSRLHVLAEPFSSVSQSSDRMVLSPLVVCGPSGVGKGTIIQKFMEELGGKDQFQFTVSHTTRSPRPGEVDGVHYHFIDLESMKQAIETGRFLEHAQVHGNYYGTSWQSLRDVQRAGKRCILDIDVQGVKNIKRMESDTMKPRYIFISPPSLEVLEERLKGRATESAESLARRTANAKAELDYGMADGHFDAILVNNDLDVACREFAMVVRAQFDL
jgi:guanylate kinase